MAQSRQRRLLIIERSRTLRLGLRALLGEASDGSARLELDLVDSFDLALRRVQTTAGGYDAVVLGWSPGDGDEDFNALLSSPALGHGFVLVLSQDMEPAARQWVSQQDNAAYAMWHDSAEIYQMLIHGMRESQRRKGAPAALTAADAGNTLRFLLVDDSASSRVFFRRLLGSRGYEVDTAASITEAREKLKLREFDVALVDFYLPGMHGDEFVREIKSSPDTAGVTCCVITGAYSETLIRSSLEAGAVECLFKNEAGELFLSQIDAIARTVRDSRSMYAKEQLLDGILDSVGEGVFGIDADGRLAFTNARALELLALDNESSLVGIEAEELFVRRPGDLERAGIAWMRKAYAARGFLRPVARQMRRGDGVIIDVTVSAYPLRIHERDVGTVVSVREVTNDRSLERQAWWHATHDALTGVLNRRYFEVQIESELHQLRRSAARHALLVVALEAQDVNVDANGAANGHGITSANGGSNGSAVLSRSVPEVLLRDVGDMLVDRARNSDLVAYFGDGRFAVLLRDADPEYASSIQAGFRSMLEEAVAEHPGLGASAGIAVLDQSINSPNQIVALASLAQRVASGKGLNGITFHLASAEDEEPVASL